jgi:hypothetical protein
MQSIPANSLDDEHPPGPPEVRMFWTGPPLSAYERLSLQSFLAAGARVILYVTSKTLQVPDGVERVDVNELSAGPIRRYLFPDGDPSPALFSDLARYMLLHRFGGWYADLDMICLGRLPTDKVYIARQRDTSVNGAIMKFPAHSPVMASAIERAQKILPTEADTRLSDRNLIGPVLVTQLVHDYALDHLVRPISSAYAIKAIETPALFDPRRCDELNERIADSDFVHLWNEYWRRVRIPKDLGPPKGSFLDGLFARFGISFDDEARLTADAVAAWFEENTFLVRLSHQLGADFVPGDALARLTVNGHATMGMAAAAVRELPAVRAPVQFASAPQTVRTFWAGGAMGPYQLLGLRSFADRGHRVEVFTFDKTLSKPSWITWRNAADIVPAERVVRKLAEPAQSAIHASLFRHALLHRHGGWWIDPDVVLLGTELPDAEMFIVRSEDARFVSPAAMKFPEGYAALAEVLFHSVSFDDKPAQWDKAGSALLAECLAADGLLDQCRSPEATSPISPYEVEMLFDPARADMVEDKLANGLFLDLHQDAWLRAGVPRELGPPLGSYLDRLFMRHEIGWPFAARIEFGDLRRWFAHMHRASASD